MVAALVFALTLALGSISGARSYTSARPLLKYPSSHGRHIKRKLKLLSYSELLKLPRSNMRAYFTALRDFVRNQEYEWREHYGQGHPRSFSSAPWLLTLGLSEAWAGDEGGGSCGINKIGLSSRALETLSRSERCVMGGEMVCLHRSGNSLWCSPAEAFAFAQKQGCPKDGNYVMCVSPLFAGASSVEVGGACCVKVTNVSSVAHSVTQFCATQSSTDRAVTLVTQNPKKYQTDYDKEKQAIEHYCGDDKSREPFDNIDCNLLNQRIKDIGAAIKAKENSASTVCHISIKGVGNVDGSTDIELTKDADKKYSINFQGALANAKWKKAECSDDYSSSFTDQDPVNDPGEQKCANNLCLAKVNDQGGVEGISLSNECDPHDDNQLCEPTYWKSQAEKASDNGQCKVSISHGQQSATVAITKGVPKVTSNIPYLESNSLDESTDRVNGLNWWAWKNKTVYTNRSLSFVNDKKNHTCALYYTNTVSFTNVSDGSEPNSPDNAKKTR